MALHNIHNMNPEDAEYIIKIPSYSHFIIPSYLCERVLFFLSSPVICVKEYWFELYVHKLGLTLFPLDLLTRMYLCVGIQCRSPAAEYII